MAKTQTEIITKLKSSLDSFLASKQRFNIVTTVSQTKHAASSALDLSAPSISKPPKTLFILDSSFNPPTKAHLSLATSALRSAQSRQHAFKSNSNETPDYYYSPPFRLLLLFSVHNATKAPAPAAFEQRLAMMYLSAIDFVDLCQNEQDFEVDVGITSEPYYSDKSAAIDESTAYGSGEVKHVHLIGHDTFLRFLDPKYYNAVPPLSALDEFFGKHGLRMTLRPDSANQVEQQKESWNAIARGDLEPQGGKSSWAKSIEVVEANDEYSDMSSTAVRKACEKGDWSTVEKLCTRRMTQWLQDFQLFTRDAGAAGKM